MFKRFQSLRTRKKSMIGTCLSIVVMCTLLWLYGFFWGYLSDSELYVLPVLNVVLTVLAALFFTLDPKHDALLVTLTQISCGVVILNGLVEGALLVESNIEFYLLTLPPYYLVLMFSDSRNRSIRLGHVYFFISSLAIAIALFLGPHKDLNPTFVLMLSVIFVQFVIVRLFGILQKIIVKSATHKERARNFENVARLSEAAREEAINANRMKSQFIANISHELRTPLNAIIGFSELIQSVQGAQSPEKFQEYNGLINKAGRDLLMLVNDLLDMSKLEAGKVDVIDSTVNLADIAAEVITQLRPLLNKKSLRIDISQLDDTHHIRGDRRLIWQVLQNLLSNACKFNRPGGRITVKTTMLSDGSLQLSVADTGIGMDAKTLETVLEPFARAESSYLRTIQGTGLGLYLVDSMIALHGGSVAIMSEPDVGTTVTVTFPKTRVIFADDLAGQPLVAQAAR